MAENAGFLEKLGIPSTDERAILDAQRAAAVAQGSQASNYAMGQQARPLLVGGLNALGGLLTGKDKGRSFRGIASNFGKGIVHEADRQVAAAAGIAPETLKARRAIREEIGKTNFKNPEAFETQISMAKKVAAIALKNGDASTYGKAIAALSGLQVQKTEFDKLKSQEARDQQEHDQDGIIDAMYNVEAVAGPFTTQIDESGAPIHGMMIADEFGETHFAPFGKNLRRIIKGANGESLNYRIRNTLQRDEGKAVRASIIAGTSAVRKFDRVMTNIREFTAQGRAGAVTGKGASGAITFLDSAVRAVKDTASQFVQGSAFNRDNAGQYRVDSEGNAVGVRSWMQQQVQDPNSELWNSIALPKGVEQTSADAQNYRAHIIELAYMAARMREPSNRGLSDNDVRMALESMGDSSNPQVVMTRFAEFMGDSMHEAELLMNQYTQGMFDAEPWEVEQAIAGNSMQTYREAVAKAQQKHGFTYDDAGRVKFESPVDVVPGGGVMDAVSPVEAMPDAAFEEALFGPADEEETAEAPALLQQFGTPTVTPTQGN